MENLIVHRTNFVAIVELPYSKKGEITLKDFLDIIFMIVAIFFIFIVGGIGFMFLGIFYGIICVVACVMLLFEFLNRLIFNKKDKIVKITITKNEK